MIAGIRPGKRSCTSGQREVLCISTPRRSERIRPASRSTLKCWESDDFGMARSPTLEKAWQVCEQAAPAIEGHDVSVDTAAARTAARQYLTAAGVHGTVRVTGGNTITVDVTDTYTPKFLSIIGIGHLTVTSEASARLIRSLGGTEQ